MAIVALGGLEVCDGAYWLIVMKKESKAPTKRSLDGPPAQQYGRLRATLEREGQLMGNLDAMIAAHALALDAVLVTNDHAFARIKKLRLADWTKEARH
jgi:predicted nucleic acid-binding protein